MHVRRLLLLARFLLSAELSFNFTLSERDIIYSFHANPGNGLFEYSHYFRNARLELLGIMKIDHRTVLLFEWASPLGAQAFTLFPNAAIWWKWKQYCDTQYVMREPRFKRMILKVCFSFYYFRCTEARIKLSLATGAGYKVACCWRKNIRWSNQISFGRSCYPEARLL